MIPHRVSQALLAVGSLTLLGCDNGSVAINYHEHRPPPRPVVVEHVCHDHCGHYYDGDRVIVIRERHVHGPGCGHYYDGRRWVVVRRDYHPRPQPVIHKGRDPDYPHGPPPRKVIVR